MWRGYCLKKMIKILRYKYPHHTNHYFSDHSGSGFLNIRMPFILIKKTKNSLSASYLKEEGCNDFPLFEDDPELSARVIKKQLKPAINLKDFQKLLPGCEEQLFRIRIIRRKVSA